MSNIDFSTLDRVKYTDIQNGINNKEIGQIEYKETSSSDPVVVFRGKRRITLTIDPTTGAVLQFVALYDRFAPVAGSYRLYANPLGSAVSPNGMSGYEPVFASKKDETFDVEYGDWFCVAAVVTQTGIPQPVTIQVNDSELGQTVDSTITAKTTDTSTPSWTFDSYDENTGKTSTGFTVDGDIKITISY